MSESLRELRLLSDDELIKRHDEHAQHTQVGINHYLAELSRRDLDRQTQAMLRYTWWITIMTGVMLLLTLINVFFAFRMTSGSVSGGPCP